MQGRKRGKSGFCLFSFLFLPQQAANVGGEPQKKQPIKKIKKPGRNDPCPCGKLRPNGLPMKYKDCCGKNN